MEKTHGNGEMEIDLLEIFYALKKRALIIVAVLLAGAVLAGIYTRMMVTPVYRATSTWVYYCIFLHSHQSMIERQWGIL